MVIQKSSSVKKFLLSAIFVMAFIVKTPNFPDFQFAFANFGNESSDTNEDEVAISTLQSAVESVTNKYQPVVVSIIATKDLPTIKDCNLEPGDSSIISPFGSTEDLLENCVIQSQKIKTGGGTGFIIEKQGVVLTNKHVVSDLDADYTVLFNDGTEEKATQIYRDDSRDVAFIQVNRDLNNVADLGNSDNIKKGQFVVAIGNALGELENSASFGIISGIGRTIEASSQLGDQTEKLEEVIQTDAAINPGNSGGPLINMQGEVVAMNTAKAQAENIGFAIPINDIKPILDRFLHQ